MTINFGGISSGMDTQAIVDAMVAVQQQPIHRIEERRAGFETQISDIGKVKSALSELDSLMKDMKEVSNVLSFSASSSDEDVLTAAIEGAASAGTYGIDVSELAAAEKDRSAALSSKYAAMREGTITIAAGGGESVDVEIETGDTIEDVVQKINKSGAAVDASYIDDGDNLYVQLAAKQTGFEIGGAADDAITITEDYRGNGGAEFDFTQVVAAKNAVVDVDGLSVESRTNTLTDVVEDVSITLTGTGYSELAVAADREGTQERLTDFVDHYNDVLGQIRSQTRNADGSRSSAADPTLTRLESELRSLIGQTVAGATGSFDALSQVGITTTSQGELELDKSLLEDAMDADMRGIGDLFTLEDEGIAAKFMGLVERYNDSTDGTLAMRVDALNDRIDDASARIESLQLRLDKATATIEAKFTAMEQAMSQYQLQSSALASIVTSLST
ncbi:MAG: hypothetical protein CSA66_06160 [Proteobacteria bacterium]|nr:MAG: hypothetical protein CSA66_06160 [Pseudomonadota bacterium]